MKADLLIQQLVTGHDILRDSTLSSEPSLGRAFPPGSTDYASEPSVTLHHSGARGQLGHRGLQVADEHGCKNK